jgi:hypothetical protein
LIARQSIVKILELGRKNIDFSSLGRIGRFFFVVEQLMKMEQQRTGSQFSRVFASDMIVFWDGTKYS